MHNDEQSVERPQREQWIHWFALAIFGLLGLVRCVIGVLYQGWMMAYYPPKVLTPDVKHDLFMYALAFGVGVVAFLALAIVSSRKAVQRLRANSKRRNAV